MDPHRPLLTQPKYRPDIDGLRAIAVVSVILFHAYPNSLRGGFIGVDIFFAISGFLISTIIIQSLERKRFSFREFYMRRARRIFPALSLTLCFSCGAGFLILYADEFQQLGKHIAAGVGFISNLVLLRESGYFDTTAETKPLLHLWSLGIEEQFYIFWPLLLCLGWKRKRDFYFLALSILLVSFGLNIALVRSHAIATFYSPATRAWELLTGSVLAWILLHNTCAVQQIREAYGAALSYVGFGVILLALVSVSRNSAFPGGWAILPVLGTALLILAGPDAGFNRTVLSHPVAVWFGLISYPLYLWHWPLLSFSWLRHGGSPSMAARTTAVLLSILLAWITFRFVETPIRRSANSFAIVVTVSFLMFGIGLVGARIYLGSGSNIFTTRHQAASETETAEMKPPPSPSGSASLPSVMLLGDSHARHLIYGLNKVLNGVVSDNASPGCIPFYDVDRYDHRFVPGDCARAMNQALDTFEKSKHLRMIILASMGPVYLTNESFRNSDPERTEGQEVILETDRALKDRWTIFETGMRNTLRRLTHTGKAVLFVIDVPELGITHRSCVSPPRAMAFFGTTIVFRQSDEECRIPRSEYDERAGRYKRLVSGVLKEFPNVIVYDPTSFFCDERYCYGKKDGQALYSDVDHLSELGSELIAQRLSPLITAHLD